MAKMKFMTRLKRMWKVLRGKPLRKTKKVIHKWEPTDTVEGA